MILRLKQRSIIVKEVAYVTSFLRLACYGFIIKVRNDKRNTYEKTNKSVITNAFSYDIDIGINCYNLPY